MTRRTGRGAALALALVLVVSACSSGGGKKAATGSGSSAPASTAATDSNQAVPGKTSFGPDDDDAIIKRAVDDVQSFYEEESPKLYGKPFAALTGGLFPYGPTDPPPNCGGPGTSDYAQVAQNAFYCPEGDFMA